MQGIVLLFVGKTDDKKIKSLTEEYIKRSKRFIPIEIKELPDIKNRSLSQPERKEREGEQILNEIGAQDQMILLDENGKEYSSRGFAAFIEEKMQKAPRRLYLVIGGPYGFSDAVYQAANGLISLSQMTFSHQMVRLFLAEQVYRACTILNGIPYHHD